MAIGIDRSIEQPDDDYEPRDLCQECERDVDAQGHAVNCSYHPQFWDRPEREVEADEDCGVGE